MAKIILNWQFEVKVDDLPNEPCLEVFVIGSPGKIPTSFRVPKNSADYSKEIEDAKRKIKMAFCQSALAQLQGESLGSKGSNNI